MDFRPLFGQRFDPKVLPGDVAGNIRQHGEGCQHGGLVVTCGLVTARRATAAKDDAAHHRQRHRDFAGAKMHAMAGILLSFHGPTFS
ncbi:hypothetical protein GCM10007359_16050 [Rothia aerolata]|uniref:Uncharacterized protein n=1 Tax=Rothia aerolata TaxID=1812262 RepID=A0A917IUP5_9MICC|nr:hypothetical protein GCM10007359_16050 [Rothia aerolata]